MRNTKTVLALLGVWGCALSHASVPILLKPELPQGVTEGEGDGAPERRFLFGSPADVYELQARKAGWQKCADEHGICDCNGMIRYGEYSRIEDSGLTYGDQWWSITYITDVPQSCTNDVFGDPLFGTVKRCECNSEATPPSDTPRLESGWRSCAVAGQTCPCIGWARYGNDREWSETILESDLFSRHGCHKGVFGGDWTDEEESHNRCECLGEVTDYLSRKCADEGGDCSCSGVVSFGTSDERNYVNADWTIKPGRTTTRKCDPQMFGDSASLLDSSGDRFCQCIWASDHVPTNTRLEFIGNEGDNVICSSGLIRYGAEPFENGQYVQADVSPANMAVCAHGEGGLVDADPALGIKKKCWCVKEHYDEYLTTTCAVEGGDCTCDGVVSYGTPSKRNYVPSQGTRTCDAETFGDPEDYYRNVPEPGAQRTCQCTPSRPNSTPIVEHNTRLSFIGQELRPEGYADHVNCLRSRFGVEPFEDGLYKDVTFEYYGHGCIAAAYGIDPAPGRMKSCWCIFEDE